MTYEEEIIAQAMIALDVCEALRIRLPSRRFPNYGSGLAGGSQMEGDAQTHWYAQLRNQTPHVRDSQSLSREKRGGG